MSKFFSRLNYSFGNEDWQTEKKALKLKPQDRIVCITASGDRPLHLLLEDCKEMIAVDMNPFQNHLLNLKAAAMEQLNFEDYICFLGGKDLQNSHRKEMLNKLLPSLSPEAGRYWKKQHKEIQKGILYQGAIEKWTKVISFCIKSFRKEKLDRLFAFRDLEEQKEFVQKEWMTKKWKKAWELVLNPFVTRFLLKDPGLHEHLDKSLHVGNYIRDRLHSSLQKGLARENLLISLIFIGKVLPEGYPPYLTEKGTETIRRRLSKLSIVNSNIIDYLESAPVSSIDAFSLSDVSSYLNASNFQRLVHAINRAAKPGARFCLRQFLSNHKIPDRLASTFKRDHSLEQELEHEDRCFVYRFIAGTIDK